MSTAVHQATFVCTECHKDSRLAERCGTMCFSCSFWTEKVTWANDDYVVRIRGQHFTIGEEDAPYGFQGFGGREFTIAFFDGRRVVTRNLWAQGDIPAHFRDRLPDNAIFEKG